MFDQLHGELPVPGRAGVVNGLVRAIGL
jgi:hypothetical protein